MCRLRQLKVMDCWIGIQAYDFMVMARDFDLKAQFGGNDQWSNIIAGVDLTRKTCGKEVYGLTVALLTTSESIKMGKTQKGALWLDESKCSVYDFFQYWRNVADADVNKCLRMLTFLPMDEVNRLSALEGAEINKAKEILAFEVTKLVHGKEVGLEPSTSEAYRTIQGGGARINGTQITDKRYAVTEADFENGELVLQKGKKKYMKITLK